MFRITVRSLWALLAATALAVGIPAAAAHPPPAAADTTEPPEVVRHTATESPSRAGAVLEHWTPQRMQRARPLSRLLSQDGAASLLLSWVPDSGQTASPSPQQAPDGAAAPWHGSGVVTEAVGRVFLTMDGRDFTCSGAVVRSEHGSAVATAGHCLTDGEGAWAENWVFVPGYEGGRAPYGRFAARELVTSHAWAAGMDEDQDFGIAVLHPDHRGTPVAEAADSVDIAFGTGAGDPVHAFGYPAVEGHDGRALHYCSGRTRADPHGAAAIGVPCSMTQGSSGGPFLAEFDPDTGDGTLISVISFKYTDDRSTQYGPRLGDTARAVYRAAREE